jgi:uncharacterized membrane protein
MISLSAPRLPQMQAPEPKVATGGASIAVVSAVVVSAAAVLLGTGPVLLQAPAGLFLLVGVPVALVSAKVRYPAGTKLVERSMYSFGLVVLAIMVVGLAINYLLPLLGVSRPLDRIPVVVTLLVVLSGLALWRRDRWRLTDGLDGGGRSGLPTIDWRDQVLLIAGTITLVGAVAGALRLNNGASGAVTLAMLVCASLVLLGLCAWRIHLRGSTILATIYLVSLSLLLMTSLRGWLTTGHDVQREFRVFQLAANHGLWDVHLYENAYNACLSVTILPTVVQHVTGVADVFVYKTVFQLLYAFCPVIIYLITRRFATRLIAILAAVYFIAFPTFFTDMPFLNRQEVAFVFVGLALLVITNQEWSVWARRIGFVVFAIGVILSHYSTTYVLLAVLGLCWVYLTIASLIRRGVIKVRIRQLRSGRRGLHHGRRRRSVGPPAPVIVNLAVVVLLAGLTVLWVGPLTGTASQVERTFSSTVDSLMNLGSSGKRSSDSSFSLFGGRKVSPEERMGQYQTETTDNTKASREQNELYPLDEVRKFPMRAATPIELPPTALGRTFESLGVDVSSVNRTIRQVIPIFMQLVIALGLLLVLLGRARGFRPSREFVGGAAASLTAIALHVLLPDVSVDYGIFRTFAQGLFWLAPFLAVGSIQAFAWLGESASRRVGIGAAIFTFLAFTSVIPQLLGGNQPQLHLNNRGLYYSNFYLHEQEMAAMRWIERRMAETRDDSTVQTEVASDRYAVNRLNTYSPAAATSVDIYPMLIRKNAYAFLGYTAVVDGRVSFLYSGDLVTYEYPVGFLDHNKSLVYSSDVSRVYR